MTTIGDDSPNLLCFVKDTVSKAPRDQVPSVCGCTCTLINVDEMINTSDGSIT